MSGLQIGETACPADSQKTSGMADEAQVAHGDNIFQKASKIVSKL